MIEEWKDVVGWEEKYKVSNIGRVWNKISDKEVAQVLTGIPQYKYVNMNLNGLFKLKRVHTLVAQAFIDNPEQKKFVDHIDRDKMNNNLTNLRWATNSENQRNLESNVFVGDEHVRDYVTKYENPNAAYTYILTRTGSGMGADEAIEQYEEFLEYGLLRSKIEYNGKEHYLVDLAESHGLEYGVLRNRLSKGINIWNALYDIPESYPNAVEIRAKDGTIHWYSSQAHFCSHHKRAWSTVKHLLEADKTLEDILDWDGKDHLRQTVLGVTGTIVELCKHFEVTESAVSTMMTKKGFTLEQALTAPRQRVKRLGINGVYNSPKYWYESFGIDPKRANGWKASVKGRTFKDTFNHFGVDTSEMIISLV